MKEANLSKRMFSQRNFVILAGLIIVLQGVSIFSYCPSIHTISGTVRSRCVSPGAERPGTPAHAILLASPAPFSFARPVPPRRTELPLKTVEPPLPDLFLLFGEHRSDIFIHLHQGFVDLRAGIGADLVKLLHVHLQDGLDIFALLGGKVQATLQVGEQALDGNFRRPWGSG